MIPVGRAVKIDVKACPELAAELVARLVHVAMQIAPEAFVLELQGVMDRIAPVARVAIEWSVWREILRQQEAARAARLSIERGQNAAAALSHVVLGRLRELRIQEPREVARAAPGGAYRRNHNPEEE